MNCFENCINSSENGVSNNTALHIKILKFGYCFFFIRIVKLLAYRIIFFDKKKSSWYGDPDDTTIWQWHPASTCLTSPDTAERLVQSNSETNVLHIYSDIAIQLHDMWYKCRMQITGWDTPSNSFFFNQWLIS